MIDYRKIKFPRYYIVLYHNSRFFVNKIPLTIFYTLSYRLTICLIIPVTDAFSGVCDGSL